MAIRGNALVMQSGGSTAVLNSSLMGIVLEVQRNGGSRGVYGALHGLEGVLSGRIIDLSSYSGAKWRKIARTPGAALGSSRRTLRDEDIPAIIDAISKYDISYWFIIGGNDSVETGRRISVAAKNAKKPTSVIAVPKTIDNDLILTDHSPGYGSAARFVAMAVMGIGMDAEGMGNASPITILEVMGRDSGWLAAASALGKRRDRDAPHLICVPEVPVDESRFLEGMDDAYRRFGFAVAVVAENARGSYGVLGSQQEPWYVDEFGHPYFEGAGRVLATLLGQHLGLRVRYENPGTIQRSMISCVSKTDVQEAEMVGRAAVCYALQGERDQMVTLIREDTQAYACSTGLASLDRVAGKVRQLPVKYFDPVAQMATREFLDYARPLIGGPLPKFDRIR